MRRRILNLFTTELELSNECWANSIRQNASYFFDLFFGQMKSTLTCKECNKIKIKYENFSAVELPISTHTATVLRMMRIGEGRALNGILAETARNILIYGLLVCSAVLLS